MRNFQASAVPLYWDCWRETTASFGTLWLTSWLCRAASQYSSQPHSYFNSQNYEYSVIPAIGSSRSHCWPYCSPVSRTPTPTHSTPSANSALSAPTAKHYHDFWSENLQRKTEDCRKWAAVYCPDRCWVFDTVVIASARFRERKQIRTRCWGNWRYCRWSLRGSLMICLATRFAGTRRPGCEGWRLWECDRLFYRTLQRITGYFLPRWGRRSPRRKAVWLCTRSLSCSARRSFRVISLSEGRSTIAICQFDELAFWNLNLLPKGLDALLIVALRIIIFHLQNQIL